MAKKLILNNETLRTFGLNVFYHLRQNIDEARVLRPRRAIYKAGSTLAIQGLGGRKVEFQLHSSLVNFAKDWEEMSMDAISRVYLFPSAMELIARINYQCKDDAILFARNMCHRVANDYWDLAFGSFFMSGVRTSPQGMMFSVLTAAVPYLIKEAETESEKPRDTCRVEWLKDLKTYYFAVRWTDSEKLRGIIEGEGYSKLVTARNFNQALEHGRAEIHSMTGTPFRITSCHELKPEHVKVSDDIRF